MEIFEIVFLILTFCSGMVGIFSSTLGFIETGFIFIIITFIFGILTIYFSCKNTDKK